MLNLLQRASKEFDPPGNLFLAISSESTTSFLSIKFFLIKFNSPFKKPRSKGALCIIIFLFFIKFKNSSATSSNVSLSLRNSCEYP